jgi:hypothetical protein
MLLHASGAAAGVSSQQLVQHAGSSDAALSLRKQVQSAEKQQKSSCKEHPYM